MSPDEIRIRQRLKDDFVHYAAKCLKIRTKQGKLESFTLNQAQQHIHAEIERQKGETSKVRVLILKGRQQGCSTYVGGRYYHLTSHNHGIQTFILTHALDATNNLYKMAQRYHDNVPLLVRPSVSTNNSKELIFGALDSGYKIGTAENKAVGRSSTLQLFHGSEVAFWANASEHAKGIMQAVPDSPGTEIILESTANGVGNYFHQMWQNAEAGLSDFRAIFVPWFWQQEYIREVDESFTITSDEQELVEQYGLTPQQLSWRRAKIVDLSITGADGAKGFKQEYPNNPTEAFQVSGEDTYIAPELVMRARKSKNVDRFGKVVLGVDPARFGDDRTGIIRRQGRVAYGLESFTKKDTMEIVGIVHSIIEREKPDKVFVDIGGLGAGIYDRLIEIGHKGVVVAVNAGSTPLNSRIYYNKRSEMWGLLKAWLDEGGVQIPDNDALHADICNIRYKIDSNSRLVMEQKADMKKRGIRSPDCADALCLTFAYPNSALSDTNTQSKIAAKITQNNKIMLKAKGLLYGNPRDY